jgi:hypothetical protein
MAAVVHDREKLLRPYQVEWWKRRMESMTMGRDGPRGSRGKKALHCQIFNAGYLPNCGQKGPACSAVFDRERSFASGKATAQAAGCP